MMDLVKHTLATVDMTVWAEVALVLFVLAFIVQSIRVLLGDRSVAQTHAENMLSDGLEVPHE